MVEKPVNLKESLKKLNEIVEWFESQDEIDVEAGLGKIREGAALVKVCKKRLSEVENEFEQIQRDVEEGGAKGASAKTVPARAKAPQESDEEVDPDKIPF
ncbi:MAG: exodeoxyribonuclease VII small subunit [bacterium]|nr:exodeoxyribonuclease VII small subunit [bacterium]